MMLTDKNYFSIICYNNVSDRNISRFRLISFATNMLYMCFIVISSFFITVSINHFHWNRKHFTSSFFERLMTLRYSFKFIIRQKFVITFFEFIKKRIVNRILLLLDNGFHNIVIIIIGIFWKMRRNNFLRQMSFM